jgi:DNA-binding GntR family transcriptional regulator
VAVSVTVPHSERPSETAPARVYETLRFQIVEGVIPPGTRVNIDALARDLGVSQTPIREALQRLEADGLLVYRAARGYATTPVLDLQGLRSLFEFRLLIEPWAARMAAVDSLSNPAPMLREELKSFERRVDGVHDVRQEMLAHDTTFHRAIIGASGNPVIDQAYRQAHSHLHVFRLYPVDMTGTATVEEHREIVKAIHDCRSEDAEALMAQHIRASFERSAQAFADPPKTLMDGSSRRRASMVR